VILGLLGRWESLRHGGDAVFIPRVTMQVGGPRSFMGQLITHATKQGVRITHNRFSKARAAIIPIAMEPEALREWKLRNPGSPIIQRLDGVFYDPQKSDYDPVRNAALQAIYHELADVLLFQSDYSRQQCEHFLGPSQHATRQTIILNGTDLDCFHPGNPQEKKGRRPKRFITVGNFRDPEMLGPLLEALDGLEADFILEVAGPVKPDFEALLHSRTYVTCLGTLQPAALAEQLREADVFLFSFLNPNCPNAVIEATACGLPVVGFDSGAMRELCGFNADLLAPVQSVDPVIHKRSELESAAPALRVCIERCLSDLQTYRERALANRTRFDIATALQAYLKLTN
jgi:glycosyltransferase involved in cell wall biosynthesis